MSYIIGAPGGGTVVDAFSSTGDIPAGGAIYVTHDAVALADTYKMRFKFGNTVQDAPVTESISGYRRGYNLLPAGTRFVNTSGGGVLGKFTANPSDMTTVRDRLCLRGTGGYAPWISVTATIAAFHGADLTVDNSVELTMAQDSMDVADEAYLGGFEDVSNYRLHGSWTGSAYRVPTGAWYLVDYLSASTLGHIQTSVGFSMYGIYAYPRKGAGEATMLAVAAGDHFTIAGVPFTAVNPGPANPAAQEFLDVAASGSSASTASSLATAINDPASQVLLTAALGGGHTVSGVANGPDVIVVTGGDNETTTITEDTAGLRISLPFGVASYALEPAQAKAAFSWDGVNWYYNDGVTSWQAIDVYDWTEWDTKGCLYPGAIYSSAGFQDALGVDLDATDWAEFDLLKPVSGELHIMLAGRTGSGYNGGVITSNTLSYEYLAVDAYYPQNMTPGSNGMGQYFGVSVSRISTTVAKFSNAGSTEIPEAVAVVEIAHV